MHNFKTNKQLIVETPRGLYKWSRIFNRLQRNFFDEPLKLRREKQIEDFIVLNGFKKVRFKTDTDLFLDFDQAEQCEHSHDADLTVITDQKFSRYPCPIIIEKILEQLDKCPNLFLGVTNSLSNFSQASSIDQGIYKHSASFANVSGNDLYAGYKQFVPKASASDAVLLTQSCKAQLNNTRESANRQ